MLPFEIGPHDGDGAGRILLVPCLIAKKPDNADHHLRQFRQTVDKPGMPVGGKRVEFMQCDRHRVPDRDIGPDGVMRRRISHGQLHRMAAGGKEMGDRKADIAAGPKDQDRALCHIRNLVDWLDAKLVSVPRALR